MRLNPFPPLVILGMETSVQVSLRTTEDSKKAGSGM